MFLERRTALDTLQLESTLDGSTSRLSKDSDSTGMSAFVPQAASSLLRGCCCTGVSSNSDWDARTQGAGSGEVEGEAVGDTSRSCAKTSSISSESLLRFAWRRAISASDAMSVAESQRVVESAWRRAAVCVLLLQTWS